MRSMNSLVSVLLGSLAAVGIVACSSDDSSSSTQTTPYDSGYNGQTAEASAATPAVQIKVVGQGTVTGPTADGGLNCTASAGSNCSVQVGTTIFATAAQGWSFQYWVADGITADPDAGIDPTTWSGDSITTTSATPNPLDAVFVQMGGSSTPPPDAGAPKDAAAGG